MEILTLLATGVTIILGGALARVGELVLDGSLEKLINLIGAKSPDTLKKLQNKCLRKINLILTLLI